MRRRRIDYILEDQVGFLLRKANQRHRVLFSQMIRPKLQTAQLAALAKLYTDGPLHQNQLGRLIAMDSATITGVVDRLANKSLVRTGPDANDARLSVIELTQKGRELLEEALPVALEISRATLLPLTPDEAELFIELLRRVGDSGD